MATIDGCYVSNSPHVYLQTSGMFQWMACSVCCGQRVEYHLLNCHTHPERVITYPRRNADGSLDMRCAENRAAAEKMAAAKALIEKRRAEAEELALAEALIASRCAADVVRVNVDGSPHMRCVENRVNLVSHAPAQTSAIQLAEQLEKAILAEAKRRIEKEKTDEEARILAEAKRRLEAERAAAAQRRSDEVEARIQAAMEQMRTK